MSHNREAITQLLVLFANIAHQTKQAAVFHATDQDAICVSFRPASPMRDPETDWDDIQKRIRKMNMYCGFVRSRTDLVFVVSETPDRMQASDEVSRLLDVIRGAKTRKKSSAIEMLDAKSLNLMLRNEARVIKSAVELLPARRVGALSKHLLEIESLQKAIESKKVAAACESAQQKELEAYDDLKIVTVRGRSRSH